jgi:hypothetical protein
MSVLSVQAIINRFTPENQRETTFTSNGQALWSKKKTLPVQAKVSLANP